MASLDMRQQVSSARALESVWQSYDQFCSPQFQQYAASIVARNEEMFAGFRDVVRSQLDSVLQSWTKDLLPNLISPELLDSLARWAEQVEEEWPANWEDGEAFWSGASALMGASGVPVVWLPRLSIVEELIEAGDVEAVLLARRDEILEDCVEAVAVVSGTPVAVLVPKVAKAVAAARDGHWEPVQSYCGSILTAILQVHMRFRRFPEMQAEFDRDPDDQPYRLARLYLLGVCVNQALANCDVMDPVQPSDFNRHSAAHTVDEVQFQPANALVGLMLISSLVRELHQLQSNGVWNELRFGMPELAGV
ncbi:MAG: hypothetical protein R2707_16490 [Acidimicrobiales bacterium]